MFHMDVKSELELWIKFPLRALMKILVSFWYCFCLDSISSVIQNKFKQQNIRSIIKQVLFSQQRFCHWILHRNSFKLQDHQIKAGVSSCKCMPIIWNELKTTAIIKLVMKLFFPLLTFGWTYLASLLNQLDWNGIKINRLPF